MQRAALNLCSEAVQQAVLGTPPSPWSWMLLLLTSNTSSSTVLVCRAVLACLPISQPGCDLLFESHLAWAIPAFPVEYVPCFPPKRSRLASNELYLTSVVSIMCSASCCNSLICQCILSKKGAEGQKVLKSSMASEPSPREQPMRPVTPLRGVPVPPTFFYLPKVPFRGKGILVRGSMKQNNEQGLRGRVFSCLVQFDMLP